ncbi:DUF1302 domain-containing protein [Zavarzinia sp. CC-PAN008]|uniref:DUF1302 domain-containing protein n=1 Tax=Zavarzinia sp. CC-PAN008 TaxID=3243332 RepID=UPI003F745294
MPDTRHGEDRANRHPRNRRLRWGLLGSTVLAAIAATGPAGAGEWTFGDVVISNQNQVSVGAIVRTSTRDSRFISTANGGSLALSSSADNGNLNFDQGSIVSNPITATSELSVIYNASPSSRFGVYGRGRVFYDWVFDVNNLDSNGFNPGFVAGPGTPPGTNPNFARAQQFNGRLDPQAQDRARYGAEMQDYYALASFDVGSMPTNVRVGNQILNWGEALFTQNAISIINPLDLQKLRVPGSEVRDALVPIKMFWAAIEPVPGLSFEGFYAWDFEGARFEPSGTFFGSEAFTQGMEGLTQIALAGDNNCGVPLPRPGGSNPQGGGLIPDLACTGGPRITYERRDQDRGDFGFAMRYFSEELNNTEFGLYYVNYQSRIPSIAYRTPGVLATGPDAAGNSASSINRNNSEYYLYYPDDIRMYGVSFNTSLDSLGIAVNGEFSYKENQFAVVDDSIVTFSYLQALGELGGISGRYPGAVPDPTSPGNYIVPCRINPDGQTLNTGCAGEEILYDGGLRFDTQNINLRGTKQFGQSAFVPSLLGADTWSVIVEGAVIHADVDTETFKFNVANAVNNGFTNDIAGNLPTRWSFGYVLSTNVTYPSAFGTPINLTPAMSFSHGVSGTTPVFGGFTEGVKTVNLALRADYLVNLSATINFNKSFGGGAQNSNADKDFLGLTVSYSF